MLTGTYCRKRKGMQAKSSCTVSRWAQQSGRPGLAARVRRSGSWEAPFPSARAVAAGVLPVLGPALVWGFDAKSKVARVRAPLLVMHGDRDEVIHFALGRELFDAAPGPKQHWTIAGAGHNNILHTAGSAYRERCGKFMMDACNVAILKSPRP